MHAFAICMDLLAIFHFWARPDTFLSVSLNPLTDRPDPSRHNCSHMALDATLLRPHVVPIFLILCGFMTFVSQTHLPKRLALLTSPIHEACNELAPKSEYRPLYRAIVCGTQMPNDELKASLTRTGLIHLMIVSGSHLVFLEAALWWMLRKRSRVTSALVISVLVVFALANRLQAPVLRALLALLLSGFAGMRGLHWRRVQVITMAGFATLPFIDLSRSSLSLLLSWTASLALTGFPRETEERETALSVHTRMYAFLAPVLLPLRVPTPMSVAFNWVFGPLIGAVFFPLSLLTFAIPDFACLMDRCWDLLTTSVVLAGRFTTEGIMFRGVGEVWGWIYLAGLTSWLLWRELGREQ